MYFAGFHLLERYNCLWSRMGHSNRLAGQSIRYTLRSCSRNILEGYQLVDI